MTYFETYFLGTDLLGILPGKRVEIDPYVVNINSFDRFELADSKKGEWKYNYLNSDFKKVIGHYQGNKKFPTKHTRKARHRHKNQTVNKLTNEA